MKENDKKKSLGKGLDEIFGGDVNSVINNIVEKRSIGNIVELEINSLIPNPYQPRKQFGLNEIKELSESIKNNGLFTPILVKKNDFNQYYIVAGERRTKASKLAGFKKINAIIVNLSNFEMQKITLIENVQRFDLNPIEIAISLKEIMKNQNLKQEDLSSIVGKSRSYVANLLGLLKLDKKIIDAVLIGKISYGHAKSLINIESDQSLNILEKIINQNLNVRETENYARNFKLKKINKNINYEDFSYFENLLENKIKTKVNISKNKIVIKYKNNNELKEIFEKINIIEK